MFGEEEIKCGPQVNFSVPFLKEIEAPLGGISVIYIVAITEGAANYNVSKTFKELEDVERKLSKKYSNLSFPELQGLPSEDTEARKMAVENLMQYITKNVHIIPPDFVKQLLGFDSEANYEIQTSNVPPKEIEPKTTQFLKTKKGNNEEEQGDLFQEFAKSKILKKQQKGSTSFFDDILDDEDEDLFGKPTVVSRKKFTAPATKPKPIVKDELDRCQVSDSEDIVPKTEQLLPETRKGSQFEFMEEEIDDSIMRLDDIDDLQHLTTQRKTHNDDQPNLNKPEKSKPIPPPKPAGLTAAASAISSKPEIPPKTSKTEVPSLESVVDINTYINSEQAAHLEEVKLFD